MSQRLTPVSRTELIARFRRLGWQGPRRGGNHAYMSRGPHKVRIPNPLDATTNRPGVSA